MSKLKYIINQIDQFMIFPPAVQHVDAARLLMGKFGPDVVSGGFIDISNNEVNCYGESISLNLKSRGDIDSQIIAVNFDLNVGR